MLKRNYYAVLVCFCAGLSAQNPIVPNQGLNDPHIHIFNDTAYVYASHDKSADNKKFTMEDWWIWSLPDLVNWTKRSVLKPEDTYIGGNFGVWDYYIARLGEDMMSLAEKPRKIELDRNVGPYGAGKTDDKPYLHKRGRKFYLSWGCFYAMADDLYGPYEYQNCLLGDDNFAPGYDTPTWPNGYKQGRHGNFFEWHGQSNFTYCDISQTGNRWFRDAFISYVHYNDDGTMANIRVDGVGVGWHPANTGVIPAEEYFSVKGMRKEQDTETGFRMVLTQKKRLTKIS